MRLEDLNWMDVETYLSKDDRLMFILGACQQHGYLSLLTDVRIPLALADASARQTGVLIGPPVNYGISPYFLSYPGTISLCLETLIRVAEDIIRSASGVGFKRFLILNGHGGNNGVAAHLVDVANSLPHIQVAWYSWWESHSVEAVCMKHGLSMDHGGWGEAFSFNRVTELPLEPKPPIKINGLPNAVETRKLCGDGVLGGPYSVDEGIMAEVFQAALDDVLHLLEF